MLANLLPKLCGLVFIAALLLFGWRRILSYLRFFQQEEYNSRRFTVWLRRHKAFDKRGTLVVGATMILSLLMGGPVLSVIWGILAATVLTLIVVWIEGDPKTTGKIRLNMTQRATKIAWVAFCFYSIATLIPLLSLCYSCSATRSALVWPAFFGLFLVQSPPWLLLLANRILAPFEKRLQSSLVSDAKRILKEVDPFVIGITGSYGKTGAKSALGELLTQALGPTFWPKKSINTVMGITRTIREDLKPYHRFAVMEMGAYNVGSIQRLCDFTPPKAALITAVGIMHLERFGSPENVYLAKSELPRAVPSDGILVCNGDNPGARRMAKEYDKETTLLYGLDTGSGHLDCYATDIDFDDKGTSFVIHWKGESYPGHTPLLGRPALSNALGAFTMACALGAQPAYTVACMANLQPVDNRLVLDRKGPIGYLRDAYNSNPTGFAAALDVLGTLPASRRVLITPGMIELGDQQFEENRKVARTASGIVDLAILVGSVNREALLAGFSDAGFPPEKLITVDSRDEGFALLADRQQSGDLVLIENDLGDLHEGIVRF